MEVPRLRPLKSGALALIGLCIFGFGKPAPAQVPPQDCASGYYWNQGTENCEYDHIAEAEQRATDAATGQRAARKSIAGVAWGAIAIATNHRMIGNSTHNPSKQLAESKAVEDCGTDCSVVISFKEQCGAVAFTSDRHQLGIGLGETEEDAARKAIAQCNSKSSTICMLPTLPVCSGWNKAQQLETNHAILRAAARELSAFVDTRHYWAAQASNGKKFASAIDQKDRVAAERGALAACGSEDCKILVTFENGCAATSTYKTPDGHMIIASETDANPYTAQTKAVKICHATANGKACGIAELSCTGRAYLD